MVFWMSPAIRRTGIVADDEADETSLEVTLFIDLEGGRKIRDPMQNGWRTRLPP
jgi:hypothetical protein